MDKVKEYLSIFFGGRLIIEGSGRTFAKAPVWLAALAAVSSIRLAVITAVLAVAFGMKVRVTKA
ncbi:MAG: DUF4342 domain-containing protein [Clostridia bacterium]|nr:DUF4342 domain-containing protein [Clostridia bacterium]